MPSLISPALPPGTLARTTQPEIAGDGVLLRPWQPDDRPAIVAAYADPGIQRWHCRTMTDDEAAAYLSRWADRWTAETGAGWAVVEGDRTAHPAAPDPAARRPAGQISLRTIDLTEGVAEISYWVLPEARGRRLAPKALATLTAWAFTDLGLHRLEVNHSTANPASCRVATRAGYPAEGTRRGAALHADGHHDMHQHARLATD